MNKYYMEQHSGNVETEQDWLDYFNFECDETIENPLSLLTGVKKDNNGDWIEV